MKNTQRTIPIGVGFGINRTQVRSEDLCRAYYVAKTDPLLVTIRKTILNYMIASGIDVYYKIKEEKFPMRESYKAIFDQEWLGGVLSSLELAFDAAGFAVVRFVPSKLVYGELVPSVLNPNEYIAFFYKDASGQKHWQIYSTLSAMSAATDSKTSSSSSKKRSKSSSLLFPSSSFTGLGEPMNDVLVFEREDEVPLWTGELVSKVAVVAERLQNLQEKYQNQAYADYWRTRQPWCTRTIPGNTVPDPMDNDHYVEDDMGLSLETHARESQVNKQDLMDTAKSYAKRGTFDLIGEPRNDSSSRYGPNPHSAHPPYLHNFPLPEGLDIAQAPMPQILPDMIQTIEAIASEVYGVFGLPPSLFIQTRAAFESQAKMSRRMLNQTIRLRQTVCEPVLRQLFSILYRNSHEDFIHRISNSGDVKKKQTKTSYVVENDNPEKELLPGVPVEGVDEELFQPEEIQELVQREVEIHVCFRHMPDTELDDIEYLYNKSWISEDTAAETAVSIVGLPAAKVLSAEEREKEIETKMKRLKTETEIASPPKEDGIAKTKKKPAAKKKPAKKQTD